MADYQAMYDTSWLQIDMPTLDANLEAIRAMIGPSPTPQRPGCELCAVLKADAYGLGAPAIARRLTDRGVGMIAVYNLAQATELAKAGIRATMLILMPIDRMERSDLLYRWAVAGRLHLTVHSATQLEHVEAIGMKLGIRMPVHVEIDTGMSRVGMDLDELDEVMRQLPSHKYVRLAGLFTHPAAADDDLPTTDRQLALLDEAAARHAAMLDDDAPIHFAGTFAAMRDRKYHKTMIRIGLGLFGYGPTELIGDPVLPAAQRLRPVVQWWSRLIHVRDVGANTGVGYNGLYVTDRPARLGVVPVGYGDGYPLALSNRGIVRIGEKQIPAPVRGQVNMDQIIIDLSNVPADDLRVGLGSGTPVEIYSNDPDAPNALHQLARLAGTNCHELLCRLSPRLTRRHVMTHERATGPLAQRSEMIRIGSD